MLFLTIQIKVQTSFSPIELGLLYSVQCTLYTVQWNNKLNAIWIKICSRKTRAEREQDRQHFLKFSELLTANKEYMRPSRFKYVFQGNQMDLTGLPQDYPYNWYLGGTFKFFYRMLQWSALYQYIEDDFSILILISNKFF